MLDPTHPHRLPEPWSCRHGTTIPGLSDQSHSTTSIPPQHTETTISIPPWPYITTIPTAARRPNATTPSHLSPCDTARRSSPISTHTKRGDVDTPDLEYRHDGSMVRLLDTNPSETRDFAYRGHNGRWHIWSDPHWSGRSIKEAIGRMVYGPKPDPKHFQNDGYTRI